MSEWGGVRGSVAKSRLVCVGLACSASTARGVPRFGANYRNYYYLDQPVVVAPNNEFCGALTGAPRSFYSFVSFVRFIRSFVRSFVLFVCSFVRFLRSFVSFVRLR